jgi:Flp pilus assembly protein TadG
VLLVPVIFAFMGFAVDLGRLYLVRGELKAAAIAAALGAAAELIGTDTSGELAAAASRLSVTEVEGAANKYYFGGFTIGESTGILSSSIGEPELFDTVADALDAGAGAQGSTTARHVRVVVSADAPLVFWRMLPLISEPATQIRAEAVAGLSAPVCTACGIEAIAIAAFNQDDPEHFGLTPGARYTLGYVCNGAGALGPLVGTTQRIPYILLNKQNEGDQVFPDEQTQAMRIGGQGLPPNSNESLSCVQANGLETVWPTATSLTCSENRVPGPVTAFLCGLATRFEGAAIPAGCEGIAESGTIVSSYVPDSDTADVEEYASYLGNRRRIITIAIVDSLGDPQNMTVLGFRQFLLEPNQNANTLNPTDQGGRFPALYIGNPMPLRAGRIGGCSLAYGPGRVVLHR